MERTTERLTDGPRRHFFGYHHNGRLVEPGRFCSPPELSGEIRRDLHPRWSRYGTPVCFDSAYEAERQMFRIDVRSVVGAP